MTRVPRPAERCKNCGRAIDPCDRGAECEYEGWVHAADGAHCCDGDGQLAAEPAGHWTTANSGPDHWTPGS